MAWDNVLLASFQKHIEERYRRDECAVFRKTKETWGEFSNMASGFPLHVSGVRILTSEALYQACRFPHRPEVQRTIIEQASPMAAKMKSKPFRKDTRPDYDASRVRIMWWCLRVKLACNPQSFGRILRASEDRPIVEDSNKDTFWGAKVAKDDPSLLVGQNVLGRLLVLLRKEFRERGWDGLSVVEPPAIPDFLLIRELIGVVRAEPGSE
jgi:type I restriction enzyme, S subunit